MIRLDLSKTQLPASSFPTLADIYVCDKCGRDITRHFRRPVGHAWSTIGPQRYVCVCGEKWLTGAVEWDHLPSWDQRRRIQHTLMLSFVLVLWFLVPGVFVCVMFEFNRLAVALALLATMLVVLPIGSLALDIAASVWRTRVRK